MRSPASQIAAALADHAEAVCRRYLSKGRREGRYWLVGDAHNTPGRSLYVRLTTSPDGRGAAGKWTDAQTGDHGDLLDIITAACGHRSLRETLDEARHFLSLPLPPPADDRPRERRPKAPTGTPEAARRLLAATQPIAGTLASTYLRSRDIVVSAGCDVLRFHRHCYYHPSADDAPDVRPAWPAMIAAVTDLDGTVTGVHRTWLGPDGGKAPVAYPRRAMGHLLGNGARFGDAGPIMVAGEGLETLLSLRQVLPVIPAIAGLTAVHLAAILFPAPLRRLYVARDDDPAGAMAVSTLTQRAIAVGIDIVPLNPRLDDFNSDLTAFGRRRLAESLVSQLRSDDAEHFLNVDQRILADSSQSDHP